MSAASGFSPRIVGFLCNWCCYAGADLCGVSRLQYPPYIRVIRLMCSGRVDPAFILRAFRDGADGVFIGGCWPGECHYVTEGNYDVLVMTHLLRHVMERIGLNPERLRLEWVSASEGVRFAEVMNDLARTLEVLGPLGVGEGLDEEGLMRDLDAVMALVPFIKLLEREKLRLPQRSPEAAKEFLNREETDQLFNEVMGDKLATGRIVSLLKGGPRSTAAISALLRLPPSDVSRHIQRSAKLGLVRYDADHNGYSLPIGQ